MRFVAALVAAALAAALLGACVPMPAAAAAAASYPHEQHQHQHQHQAAANDRYGTSLGGYGDAAGRAVASPLDTVKLAFANRNPTDGEKYGVDIGIVRRAQALLDGGLRIPADERMEIAWAGVSGIPMVWPAYQFYLQYGQGTSPHSQEVRRLLLSALRAGMSANVDYLEERLVQGSWIQMPLAECLNTREDVEVCLALMRAGHPTDPVVGNWNAFNDYGQQFVQGVSFLNLIAVGASGVPIMRVFYRMNREVQAGLMTPEETMASHLLEKYVAHTPSLNELVDTLQRREPLNDRLMTNNRLHDIDGEIEYAEMEGLFNYTNQDLREIEIAAPWNDYNPLHFCAIMGKPRLVDLFMRQFLALEEGSAYRQQVASSTKKALEFRSKFAGRNPLHLAAVREGQASPIFQALLALEKAVAGDDSRIASMRDDYGNSPYDYDGAMDSVNEASLAGYGEGPALAPSPAYKEGDFNGFPYEQEDSGGWGVVFDDTLEHSAAGVRVRGRSKCEVHEVEGMPTPEEVGLWLERNEPVMFRNAIRDWTIRDKWTRPNFVAKFGSRPIQTSYIPYHDSFDSTTPANKTTMGEYIASWGNADEQYEDSAVPKYMFSGQFASDNEDIDDDMPEFLGLLGSLPYPTKVMAKQLFVGPAMSGAPLHWHNTAMNALAYGRKHWYLVRPNQTFYSVWPTKEMVKNELQDLRREGLEVLQCAQNAGDLLLVGQSWGHATLNQHPTVGMAIEFTYRVLSTEMQLPTFMKEMATPAGQARLRAADGAGAGQGGEQNNLFAKLDEDQNGRLSKSEFFNLGVSAEVKELFRNDDVNNDGLISWHEFSGPKGEADAADTRSPRAGAASGGGTGSRAPGGSTGATYLQQRSAHRRPRREL